VAFHPVYGPPNSLFSLLAYNLSVNQLAMFLCRVSDFFGSHRNSFNIENNSANKMLPLVSKKINKFKEICSQISSQLVDNM
jgi:hypothetical protein